MFGEGVNPRLRHLRDGLDELRLPSEELLRHGTGRLIYAMSLIENLSGYLLGMEKRPKWIVEKGKRMENSTLTLTRSRAVACSAHFSQGERGKGGPAAGGGAEAVTRGIAEYWRERWMVGRLANDGAMERMRGQTLVYPVRHGARVVLPRVVDGQGEMFGE